MPLADLGSHPQVFYMLQELAKPCGHIEELEREIWALANPREEFEPSDLLKAARALITRIENEPPRDEKPEEAIWTTHDGRNIPIAKLEDRHLANIIKKLYRAASARDGSINLFNWETQGSRRDS